MAERVKPKRRYNSPRRQEQAAATRRSILDAAQQLFERQGYAATTMEAIAAEADVALKTVYIAFATKSGLLRALWDLLLKGDEDEAAVDQREWFREVIEEPDPERQLRLNARTRAVKLRIAPLLEVIRDAAPVEPDTAALWNLIQSDFYANQRAIVETLHKRHALKPGLGVTARPTSSGRSTTPTCGSCSSASAAGHPSSSSSGSPTPPARNSSSGTP